MFRITMFIAVLSFTLALTAASFAAPPAANLDQLRNGAAGSPIDPANWVNGNIGKMTGHYVESYSIAYRAVMTNLPDDGTVITLVIGYDIKHSDKHAIDYLTHYDRIDDPSHMGVFGHPPETIDPTIGVTGVSGAPTHTFTIPAPSSVGSPVPGQPTDSYNALPAAEVLMSIWNGTISDIQYVTQGDLGAKKSETRIQVTFTVTAPTAVLAWGGHIAWREEWGYTPDGDPKSAGGISGSPYHMRLIDWNLNNLGNQDRSLSAVAVYAPPLYCMITPEVFSVCEGGSATFTVAGFDGQPPYTFEWTGPNGFTSSDETITIDDASAMEAGQYCATVTDAGGTTSDCCAELSVLPSPPCDITGGGDIICGDGTTEWCATEAPIGMTYTYEWSGPGGFTASTRCITIGMEGTYEVTITDQHGCYSMCDRTLTVVDDPICEITGGEDVIPEGGTTEWCATEAPMGMTYSYAWTGPGGFTADTRCVTIGLAGTYEVTITDQYGCYSICDRTLTYGGEIPCDIYSCMLAVCEGMTAEFCASEAPVGETYSYQWTGPGGFTGDTRCIEIGVEGTYEVTITAQDGRQSTCDRFLGVYYNPACDIVGEDVVEFGLTVEWCAPESPSPMPHFYEWSGPSGFTSTDRCIDAGDGLDPQAEPYVYTVTVTHLYGCETTCQKELMVLAPPGGVSNDDGSEPFSGSPYTGKAGNDSWGLPTEYTLTQNRPNPFNPTTEVGFSLPEPSQVRLDIFNITGQRVTTLVDDFLPAGHFTATWNASGVASGIYLYRLDAGAFVETKRMVLLK